MIGSLSMLTLFVPLMAEPPLVNPTDPQAIYGGDFVEGCGFPSVVYLSGGGGACTGTLIHPNVVLTAAHCITQDTPTNVSFGNSASSAVQLSETVTCRQGPGWNGATAQGEDYGYCLLESPVTSIPIIPVVNGCEASAVYPGARIMHVGFGQTEQGTSGEKKMLELSINTITGTGELISGTPTEVICNGDSGGPTFVYLDPAQGGDGSWRVAAIHSWAQGASPTNPNCSNAAGSVLVTNAIEWIEQDSGIDITPCANGNTWDPTAHCGDFPVNPWVGDGNVPLCSAPEVVEWGSTCGPGLDETPDGVAPTVSVLSPATGDEFDADGTASVNVEAEAFDEGWGVESVSMTIRAVDSGDEQTDERNEWQSLSWTLSLPPGAYEVTLQATDHAGNMSEPQTVCFGVGGPGCGEDGGDGGDGSTGDVPGGTDGGDDDGDGGGDDGATSGNDESGSGGVDSAGGDGDGGGGSGGVCTVGGSGPGWSLFLLALAVPFRRRRAA